MIHKLAQSDLEIDTSGLVCPHPLLKAKRALGRLSIGQVLGVIATDPSAEIDFKVFAHQTGHVLLKYWKSDTQYCFLLKKSARR